jgi:hypothetical protein
VDLESRAAAAFARLAAMGVATKAADEEGSRTYTGESKPFVVELSIHSGPSLDLRVGVADGGRYWFAWSRDSETYGEEVVLDDLDAFVTGLATEQVLVGRLRHKLVFTFPIRDGHVLSRRGWSKITYQRSSPTRPAIQGLVPLLAWAGRSGTAFP